MKAFVIGGAGFIGSHIVDQLLLKNVDVVVIDNLSTGNKHWLPPNVVFYELDMFDKELERIFVLEKPDVVFHQAAQISVARSMDAPEEDARMNILGTINVLQCAVKVQVKRFIFASSAAVYGIPDQLPISEEHKIDPASFYGMSKAFAEEYIRLFSTLRHLKYSIFRYANVYGPRQNAQGEAGVIAIFFDRLLAGKPLTIYGDGTQTRDFIHVKDIATACVKSMTLTESTIMNLGTNQSVSINELVKYLMEITDTTVITNQMPRKKGDITNSYLDNQQALSQLDWQPGYTIIDGLYDMYQDISQTYRQAKDLG